MGIDRYRSGWNGKTLLFPRTHREYPEQFIGRNSKQQRKHPI